MTLLALAASSGPGPEPEPASIHSTAHLILDWANAQTLVEVGDLTGTYYSLREQDDIIYDPADPDPDRRYKLYFSAAPVPVPLNGDCHTWAIFSPDRTTWSAPVQCTVGGGPLIGEDPSICRTLAAPPVAHRASGRLIMYAEDRNTVNVYSSNDGVTWTMDGASVIARGDDWDSSLAGSPCGLFFNGSYVVAYEGISGGYESTGLAVGSTPTELTKLLTNPVFSAAGLGIPGPIGQRSAFLDSIRLNPAGDLIHVTGHAGYDGTGLVTMFRAYTTNLDPLTWEPGDFTLIGMVDPVRNDLTCDWWGDRLVTAPADDLSIVALPLKVP